ncbi:MAG: molybdate ABC transporter substrate-binding protein [Pseudonocardiaceae bacterium]
MGLISCGGGGGSAGGRHGPSPASSPGAVGGQVTVFAAASLTDAFTELKKEFEKANPGATVVFNFSGSSTLAAQIERGAPADVFASADAPQMQRVVAADPKVGKPIIFARNKLEIVVPKGNPGKVAGLADFSRPELRIAICASAVPCGAAAQRAFQAAGVTPAPDTLEQTVRAVLTKVTLGEADAGLVYRTDLVTVGDRVMGIEFPQADQAINDNSIVLLGSGPNAAAGQAFINYVLSPHGKAVLDKFGFITEGLR